VGDQIHVFMLEGYLALAVLLALLVLKCFAFVNALLWRADAFPAADKLTKTGWLVILGGAIVLQLPLVGGFLVNILNLAGTVAAIVYFVDVRPALREVTQRR
jgi:hypothetical protein